MLYKAISESILFAIHRKLMVETSLIEKECEDELDKNKVKKSIPGWILLLRSIIVYFIIIDVLHIQTKISYFEDNIFS